MVVREVREDRAAVVGVEKDGERDERGALVPIVEGVIAEQAADSSQQSGASRERPSCLHLPATYEETLYDENVMTS